MSKILLLNGPNLNLLGSREKDIYGKKSLKEIEESLIQHAHKLNEELICFQSNA